MEYVPFSILNQFENPNTEEGMHKNSFITSKVSSLNQRTKTVNPAQRKRKIYTEQKKAAENRLVKEIERQKIVFDSVNVEKPKPPQYYIDQARKKFMDSKNAFKPKPQSSYFGKPLTPLPKGLSMKSREEALSPYKTYSQGGGRPFSHSKGSSDLKSYYPSWLISRQDFIEAYYKMADENEKDIARIASYHQSQRTEDDKRALYKWALKCKFFSGMPKHFVRALSERLFRQDFKKEEKIYSKGEEAECIWLVFKGCVGVYNGSKKVSQFTETDVFGEASFKIAVERKEDAFAEVPTITFLLKIQDYDSILITLNKTEKTEKSKFLTSIRFFQNWSLLKIQRISNFLIETQFSKGEVIYDKEEESNSFYILKSGKVEVQAYIEVKQENRWPTGTQKWKLRQIKRKHIITLKNIEPGDFFGDSEMVNSNTLPEIHTVSEAQKETVVRELKKEKIPRKTRAVCRQPSVCYKMSKEEFFETFSTRDIEQLQSFKSMFLPEDEELQNKILSEIEDRSSKEKALLNAMKVDVVNSGGRESLLDSKTKKLRKWIDNLNHRKSLEHQRFRKRIVKEEKNSVEVDALTYMKANTVETNEN